MSEVNQPIIEKELPATRGMLREVRDELKADFRGLENRMDALDHRMKSLDYRMESLDHGLVSIGRTFGSFREEINSKLSHMIVLQEEQRADNRMVFEALASLRQRQDRLEAEFKASKPS
jgi:hypothetical protein